MGKPAVAFDLTEAQETARGAALYVAWEGNGGAKAFADGILELLSSPLRRASMGRIGRQRFLEVLAWEHQQATLLDAYATLDLIPSAAVASVQGLR